MGLTGKQKSARYFGGEVLYSRLYLSGVPNPFGPGVGGAILDMPHLSVFPMVLRSSAEELTRFVQRQAVLCENFVRVMFDYSQVRER